MLHVVMSQSHILSSNLYNQVGIINDRWIICKLLIRYCSFLKFLCEWKIVNVIAELLPQLIKSRRKQDINTSLWNYRTATKNTLLYIWKVWGQKGFFKVINTFIQQGCIKLIKGDSTDNWHQKLFKLVFLLHFWSNIFGELFQKCKKQILLTPTFWMVLYCWSQLLLIPLVISLFSDSPPHREMAIWGRSPNWSEKLSTPLSIPLLPTDWGDWFALLRSAPPFTEVVPSLNNNKFD